MNDKIEEFKRLYTEEALENGGPMSPELNALFEEVLKIFGDDPSKMDALIEQIREEYYGPEVTWDDRVAALETKVASIEEYLFGNGNE